MICSICKEEKGTSARAMRVVFGAEPEKDAEVCDGCARELIECDNCSVLADADAVGLSIWEKVAPAKPFADRLDDMIAEKMRGHFVCDSCCGKSVAREDKGILAGGEFSDRIYELIDAEIGKKTEPRADDDLREVLERWLPLAKQNHSIDVETGDDWMLFISRAVIDYNLAPRQARAILELFGVLADRGMSVHHLMNVILMSIQPKTAPILNRDLTWDERATWGRCEVCGAGHGEKCLPTGIVVRNIKGEVFKDGAHMARLRSAPDMIAVIGVKATKKKEG